MLTIHRNVIISAMLLLATSVLSFFAVNAHADEQVISGISETQTVPRWLRSGLIPSTAEQREQIPEALPPSTGRGTLPPAVDLSKWFPKPRSQGQQGTCASWALASYRTYLLARHKRSDPDRVEFRSSPAFIFSQIGNLKNCQGASLESGMELLKAKGVVSEMDYPYVSNELGCQRPPPTQDLLEKAKTWRTTGWGRVELREPRNANDLKVFLANQEPVVFAIDVGSGFNQLGKEVMRVPEAESNRGGHAMVLIGYDDRRGAFKILNSWGEDWGDKGFGWISYELFMKEWQYGYVASDRLAEAPTLLEQVKDDYVSMQSGQTIQIDVLANDEYDKQQSPRIYLTNKPAHGKVKVENNRLVYQPVPGFVGMERFYYALVDASNRRGVAMVEITVSGRKESEHGAGSPQNDDKFGSSEVKAHFPEMGIIGGADLQLRFSNRHVEIQVDNLELGTQSDAPIAQAIRRGGEYRLCGALESKSMGIKRKMQCGKIRRLAHDVNSDNFSLPLSITNEQLAQAVDMTLWLVVQSPSVKAVSGGGKLLHRLQKNAR